MATRFYLPSSGTSPLPSLAVDSAWEASVSVFFRAPAVTSKSGTALADFTDYFPSTSTQQVCVGQWVSAPLADAHNFTSSESHSLVVRGVEGNSAVDGYLALTIRVVSGDGSTVRGTIVAAMSTSGTTELATSAETRTRNTYSTGTFSASAGDRIVIEIGLHGATPSTSYDATLRFGDPSGTSDFALTSGLTTDLCPWLELSPDLTFTSDGHYTLAPAAGSFALTGNAATLLRGRSLATTASSGVMTAAASSTRRAYVVTSGSRGWELTASDATLSVSSPAVEMATTASAGEMTAASVPTRHAYVVTSGTLNGILTTSSAALDGTGGGTTEITATAASGELTASGLTLAVGKTLTTTASAGELTAASASLLRSRALSASPASGELSAATVPTRYAYSIDSGTISGELTASSVDLDRIVYAVPATGELVAADATLTKAATSLTTVAASGELTASAAVLTKAATELTTTAASGEMTAGSAILLRSRSLASTASVGSLAAASSSLVRARVVATAASSGSLTATTLDVSVLRIISTVRYTKTAQHGGTPDTITHQARAQVNGGSPVVTARRARTRR